MKPVLGRVAGLVAKHKWFILILLIASLLRLVHLTTLPPSLSWDEVSHGYNAYSILKTGSDEWGKTLPLSNFRAYGDYPLVLNLYLTVPFIAILGPSEFSIRLPHAILGTLTIVASYLLVWGLTKSKKISLVTALLVAIEPWPLFTSRIALQQNLSVFLLVASMAAFFNRGKNKYLLPISLLLLFLTLFAYHSTRIFSPLILVVALGIYRDEFTKIIKGGRNGATVFISAVIVFFVLAVVVLVNPSARARAQWLFILNQGAVNRIIENRQNSTLPPAISGLIYNRPTYLVYQFSKNYFEYLSPAFLFFNGGTQYQYSLPGRGLSYLINLPFFYLGILILLKKAKDGSKDYRLLLAWLALSPIAGSITSEHFAVTRASVMLPLPQILSALGAFFVFDLITKKSNQITKVLLSLFYFAGIFFFARAYLTDYFTSYPQSYSWAWQYGYRQAVSFIKNSYPAYDKIIITKKYGEPHEFLLFFWPWDPAKYKSDPNLVRYFQSGWYWVDRFDKFYFVNDWQMPKGGSKFVLESGTDVDCSQTKCLLVTSPDNHPSGWAKLETIKFLDGKSAFEIYEN